MISSRETFSASSSSPREKSLIYKKCSPLPFSICFRTRFVSKSIFSRFDYESESGTDRLGRFGSFGFFLVGGHGSNFLLSVVG